MSSSARPVSLTRSSFHLIFKPITDDQRVPGVGQSHHGTICVALLSLQTEPIGFPQEIADPRQEDLNHYFYLCSLLPPVKPVRGINLFG